MTLDHLTLSYGGPGGTTRRLALRSLTRPGGGAWRAVFPILLVAQRWYRRRYRRALGRAE